MKRTVFLLTLFFAGVVKSQMVELSQREYDYSLNSIVLVVLKYSDSLNNRLHHAFEKYWSATPFTFVTSSYQDTLKVGKGKPDYSVFDGALVQTRIVTTTNTGRRDEKGTFSNWWSYYLIPFNNKEKKPDAELVAAWGPINMSYFEWDKAHPFENTFYRIDFIVKQVNDVLEFIRKNKKASPKDYYRVVNGRTNTLQSKTLLVPQELLAKYDIWKITREQMEVGVGKVLTSKKPIMMSLIDSADLAGYGGKVKILPFKEIDQLAVSGEANKYALFSPLITDRKYVFVFDLETKQLIYADNALMSMQVNKKDIKKLNHDARF